MGAAELVYAPDGSIIMCEVGHCPRPCAPGLLTCAEHEGQVRG